jgi:hypothetical protein
VYLFSSQTIIEFHFQDVNRAAHYHNTLASDSAANSGVQVFYGSPGMLFLLPDSILELGAVATALQSTIRYLSEAPPEAVDRALAAARALRERRELEEALVVRAAREAARAQEVEHEAAENARLTQAAAKKKAKKAKKVVVVPMAKESREDRMRKRDDDRDDEHHDGPRQRGFHRASNNDPRLGNLGSRR